MGSKMLDVERLLATMAEMKVEVVKV